MKKSIKTITAITVAFSMMLTGCSLSGKSGSDEHSGASGQITPDGKLVFNSDDAGNSISTEPIVVEDLFEPEYEESSSGMSSEASSENTEVNLDTENENEPLKMVFFGDSQFANGASDGTDIATLVSQRVPNSVSYN